LVHEAQDFCGDQSRRQSASGREADANPSSDPPTRGDATGSLHRPARAFLYIGVVMSSIFDRNF
jgi:hypothetical protein